MKSLLICPAAPAGVPALAERAPLAALPLLGESPVEYWLVHLAARGAKQVTILASDRPDVIRGLTGDGARWGLRVDVVPETSELSPAEARVRYREFDTEPWLPGPDAITRVDHPPGMPERRMFDGYAAWFDSVLAWLSHARTPDRIGVHEVSPGVHVGLHSRVSRDAVLVPPCWIGEKVYVGPEAVIGPQAVVESRSVVESGAVVARSIVGPETLVGKDTEVSDSIAWGDELVDWRSGSVLRVPDAFLLCPLGAPLPVPKPGDLLKRWRLTGRWARTGEGGQGGGRGAGCRRPVFGTGN